MTTRTRRGTASETPKGDGSHTVVPLSATWIGPIHCPTVASASPKVSLLEGHQQFALVFILTPVFHDGSPEYPVWRVLNWFMAVGVAAIVAVSARRCLGSGGDDAGSRDRLTCYGAITLAMLFYWGWFWTLNPESETGAAVTSHLVYFPAMDALYVILALSTARRLWRTPR